jgi:hypothetical protein
MDVQDYLKQRPVRADSKLSPFITDLRVLYTGNASFATMRRFLSEQHGISVAIPSLWEFCKRHFSDLDSVRLNGPRSRGRQGAHQPHGSGSPIGGSLNSAGTVSDEEEAGTSDVVTVDTSVLQPQHSELGTPADASRPSPVTSSAPRAPAIVHGQVLSPADTQADATSNNDAEISNDRPKPPSFTPNAEPDHGNIATGASPNSAEQDAQPSPSLFGPPENVRQPHNLYTAIGRDRLARFRKLRDESKQ